LLLELKDVSKVEVTTKSFLALLLRWPCSRLSRIASHHGVKTLRQHALGRPLHRRLGPAHGRYNESIYFDRAIYAQDIRGSVAYARANSKIGILTSDEFSAIEKGFGQVLEEWESGKFEIKPGVDETSTRPMRGD
jgi:Lyase